MRTDIEPRPIDSRIILTKRPGLFEAVIPAMGVSGYGTDIFVAVLVGAIAPVMAIGAAMGAMALEPLVVWLPFLVGWVGFSLLYALPLIYTMTGTTTLRIDSETISLTYSLFGYTYWRPKPARRSEITLVALIEKGVHSMYSRRRSDLQVRRMSGVEIWTRDRIFNLIFYPLSINANERTAPRRHIYITRAECRWLFDELRIWLGVPAEVMEPIRGGWKK